ncbi:cupin domain-containing protein [Luteibacter yeojuensis]|uniref:Cupin n=1 Tax=Luteibacter yeojuensis TaxID=345309 RepID=A0A0F3KRL4_9GAMM|nr:cupin domain-containing protein [Luteibacter yeojuensis]KJV33863.1 cupin [Luteibacter yeojuensis]
MKTLLASATLALLAATGPALAHGDTLAATPAPKVTPVTQKDLPDYPGKEITVITVDYPPGLVEHAHRHDAHAIVYVLEGEIIEGVKGQPEHHLKAGDSFYEGPTDIHTVGRNASTTKPARFLVFILKDKKNPIVMPAP